MRRVSLNLVYGITALSLLASAFFSLLLGPVSLPVAEILALIFPFTDNSLVVEQTRLIVEQIRLPRMLLSLLVGAILGLCGAAMQGLFRNPLADPSLIGITAGAVLGASLVIVLLNGMAVSVLAWRVSLVSLGAFVGGLVVSALVYSLAYGQSNRNAGAPISVATMLLAGIAITALAASVSGMLEYIADSRALRQMSLWQMGGLDNANMTSVFIAALIFALVASLISSKANALNALLLGESEARYMGVEVEATTKQLVILVAIGMGVAVALSGAIAFIGLVVPHIFRLMVGPDHRFLLPLSAMGGAALLCAADTVARVLLAPNEIPVGIVTSLIGAPFFIYILKSQTSFRW